MENLPGDHSENPPFEYNTITEQIFLGTSACCVAHFNEKLLSNGVHGNISMEAERLDATQGAEYFLWLPTVDHTAPSMSKLRVGVRVMQELITEGEKVYVHCRNGHGRGPSLVIAYFILLGDDYQTAFEKVKSKREVIHLDDTQVERLKEFETWCCSRRDQDKG